jgi:ABC-type Zn2+ transport system substrate-binding protein/surface adhesin
MMAELDFDTAPREMLGLDRLAIIMNEWRDQDHHHNNDPAYKADFTFSPANSRIAARNIQASSARQGPA